MIGRRACLLADRHHRSTDREADDIFEGHHPAVDDRQARRDAACLEGLAVVAAETRAAPEMKCKAPTADREMAAFGLQRAGDAIAVTLQDRIVQFAHVHIPMTGATNDFRGLSTRHGGYGRPRTSGGRGTRWDRVRLNRLAGSIPVAPTLALAGRRVTRQRRDLLIRPQWVRLRAASPSPARDQAERDQTRHASVMRRARSCGRFSRSREAKLFGPPW
jgi:hypothetical protein